MRRSPDAVPILLRAYETASRRTSRTCDESVGQSRCQRARSRTRASALRRLLSSTVDGRNTSMTATRQCRGCRGMTSGASCWIASEPARQLPPQAEVEAVETRDWVRISAGWTWNRVSEQRWWTQSIASSPTRSCTRVSTARRVERSCGDFPTRSISAYSERRSSSWPFVAASIRYAGKYGVSVAPREAADALIAEAMELGTAQGEARCVRRLRADCPPHRTG